MTKKIILLLLLLTPMVLTGCRRQPEAPAEPEPKVKKKVSKPVNVIDYDERPYVVMSPTLSREVNVTVHRVGKAANGVDYLAEYQYGTSQGGNEQFIDLSQGLPATKQFALYSRSAGGKTSYEEDVQGGLLTLDFGGAADEYRLEQPWKYIDNKATTDTFSDPSSTFSVSGNPLKQVRYAIIYQSPGLPADLSAERVSEVYTLQTAPSIKSEVVISFKSDQTNVEIQSWDGKVWTPITTTVKDGIATGRSSGQEAFVLTKTTN